MVALMLSGWPAVACTNGVCRACGPSAVGAGATNSPSLIWLNTVWAVKAAVALPGAASRYTPGRTRRLPLAAVAWAALPSFSPRSENDGPKSASDTCSGCSFHKICVTTLPGEALSNGSRMATASGSTSSRHTPGASLSRKYAPVPP